MPRIARPSDWWSRVVASFAVRAGLRNVFAPTMSPSVTRSVTPAQPVSTDQPSRIGPSHGPTMDIRWSHVQSELAPARSARTAASRSAGHESVCGQSRTPALTSAMSVVLQVVVHRGHPQQEGDPRLAPERGDGGVRGTFGPVAVRELDDVLAGAVHVVNDLVDGYREADPPVRVRGVDHGERRAGISEQVRGPASRRPAVDEDPVVGLEPVPGHGLARRAIG